MANLETFRKKVRRYYRTRYHQDGKTKYTQGDLAALIPMNEDELGKRLNGYRDEKTGRVWQLTEENVLDIVLRLAELKALTWEQAVELLVLMDYPVKANHLSWQAKLREHLDPPDQVRSPISKTANGTNTAQGNRLDLPRRLFQARDLPKSYVPRPTVFNHIKQLLLNRESQRPTAIATALRGAGGFGKTTLASALCHDQEIQTAFPDGILWVELGEHPSQSLAVLNELLRALEPSAREALTLEEARERWRRALEKRTCLLVIDDVWQTEALEELLQGGSRCGRLITTRDDQLLPDEAKRVWVDAMEPAEAMALLCQGLVEAWQQTLDQSVLEHIVDQQLGCWPLLVSLARGMFTYQMKRLHKTPQQALALIHQAYRDRGMAAFREGDRIKPQQAVDDCIDVNLRQLEEGVPAHYQIRQRYQELAVFSEVTDVPLSTLQIYWQGTGGLHDWEVEILFHRLADLSLILPWSVSQGTLRLHDVLGSYLIQHAGSGLPALHQRLLDTYQQHSHLTRWADLPQSETYLWQHLVFHLCQAGNQEVLQATLTDLSYLTHKVLYEGVSALENNLLLATWLSPTETAFFSSLHRGMVRIGHLLEKAQTPAEIGGVFLSYLGGEPIFSPSRFPVEHELPRPFLTAWHSLPEGSPTALLRTFQYHTNRALGCAVSPNGSFIVSVSWDGILKVWDAGTGEERFSLITDHSSAAVNGCAVSPDGSFIVSTFGNSTLKVWDVTNGECRCVLKGHSSSVTACAVSPDGSFIVSASWDGTLKVWDVATGQKHFSLEGHSSSVNGCAVSPDGSFIVSASWDGTLKIWDAATGEELQTLAGHTGWVNSCAVSPDDSFIISASQDETLKVWETHTGQCLLTFPVAGALFGCAFHPDGEHLVAYGAQGVYFLRLVR